MTTLEPKIEGVKKLLGAASATIMIFTASTGQANTGKEFTTSVIYGTLAGALVGAATLAFTSSPGDNLNNVARGASYGLYAGILLGVYVTYGVSDAPPPNSEGTQQPSIDQPAPPQQAPPPPQEQKNTDQPGQEGRLQLKNQFTPTFALYPVFSSGAQNIKVWGVGVRLLDLKF